MEKLKTFYQHLIEWGTSYLTSTDTYIQASIIAGAFIIAGLIFRIIKGRVENRIDRLRISYRLKQSLHNIKLLIFPLLTLLFLLPAKFTAAQESLTFDFGLGSAVINLLMAWIIIRILVQFIQNGALRNSLALSIWFLAALNILGILDETITALDALGMNIGELRISALTVVKGIFAIFLLVYVANITTTLVERKVKTVDGLSMASKVLLTKVIRIFLITLAILIGITTAGIDLSLLAVFSGALGLGIGFGLQKGISNLFSGLLLLMDKSIKPGDVIELPNGAFGWIAHMGGRYTEIVTRDNKSFLIPNEDFITQQVINWSHGSSLIRIEVTFGVSYNSDPHQIKELAEEAARKPSRVVDDPSPVCHLTAFGDSSIDFSLRLWITDAQEGLTNVRGEVMLALWDTFKENDINIPFPHREVFIHNPPQADTKKTVKTKKA